MGFPVQMAKIFSNTPEYLSWAKIIIYNGNISTCVCEIPCIITSLLQAMRKGNQASVLSFLVQLLPIPIAALILYQTDKHNIGRLIYCYPFQTFFGVGVSIPFIVVALRNIIKSYKVQLIADGKDTELENMSISCIEKVDKIGISSYKNIKENVGNVDNGVNKDDIVDE